MLECCSPRPSHSCSKRDIAGSKHGVMLVGLGSELVLGIYLVQALSTEVLER